MELPMTDQPRIRLNDGRDMPQLGYGVFQVPPEETERLVADAIDVGYEAVDTATFYRNESGVGRAVRDSGKTIFVTTKLWNDNQGYDQALRAFDASYRALGLDAIDLYLIHWPKPHLDLYVETWKALIRLRDEGRVKTIGVSNFTAAHLERIIHDTGVVPAVNQIELHPHLQQVELRAFHEENGIVTTSWSPLGRGAVLGDQVIAGIARKHGRTPAQVIIRWHIDLGLTVIPKSSSRARQAENLDVFGFSLDDEDMQAIAGLDRPDGRIGPDPDVL
jgi:2,5-diketo-D-gluconate reductase A